MLTHAGTCAQVLAFYAGLGMALPERPPLMLVDGPALNEAESAEGRSTHEGGAAAQPVRPPTSHRLIRARSTLALVLQRSSAVVHARRLLWDE